MRRYTEGLTFYKVGRCSFEASKTELKGRCMVSEYSLETKM